MADAPSDPPRPLPVPSDASEVLPFLPLIWVAWSDGVLGEAEMAEIRARIGEDEALSADARLILESWLRPDAPPDASDLSGLRERIRVWAADVPEKERRSLSSLGVALARSGGSGPDRWGTAEGMRTLRAVEELMGVLGGESTRELMSDGHPAPPPADGPGSARLRDAGPGEAGPGEAGPADAGPEDTASRAAGAGTAQAKREESDGSPVAAAPEVPGAREAAPFDPAAMARYLDSPFAHRRAQVHELLRDPALQIPRELPTPEYRARVLEAIERLAEAGLGRTALPPEWGGEDDAAGAIATFEALAYGDLSVLVKFGVQFGLFGGSIFRLGTERHHRAHLRAVAAGELLGCYAMTERDHGSNVRDVETLARYLPETDEFEVHTPHPGARKDWIGNAALHGRMATVFAQLEVAGEGHGVHAFLVPIRDGRGRPLEGIAIEDCGEKVGLHGVDNGRLAFDRVRIPRTNLLNRFGDVTPDGRYRSPIASDGRRFFAMLGTLVSGRISIAAASVSASKTALAVAVRYSSARRQFGPPGRPEVPVLDFLTHQRLLMPRVAATYAFHFAVRDLVAAHAEASSDEARTRVDALAGGLKALASRHAQETIQACREACGGRGYLADNRLGALRADTDVFTTFEGANVVLLQLVAKALLSEYRDDVGDLRFRGMLRFLAERMGTEITRRNPVRSRRTGEESLRDPEVQLETFFFREQRLLETAARRLKWRIDEGMDSFDAMNECQDHLVALARAHVERAVLESFRKGVAEAPSPELAHELGLLADLWALWRIEADRAWFLESGYLEGSRTRAIRAAVNRLVAETRERGVALVDGFGIPDDILRAPAAFGE